MDTVENQTPLVNDGGFKDCLPLIFSFLPLKDQFAFSQVCREWKELAERCLKKLDFSDKSSSQLTFTDLEHILQTFPNINKVSIDTVSFESADIPIVTVAENCPHLIEISISVSIIMAGSFSRLAECCPLLKDIDIDIGYFASEGNDEILSLVKACENLETFSVGMWENICLCPRFVPDVPDECQFGPEVWLKHLHSPLRSLTLKYFDLKPQSLLQGIYQCKGTLNKLALDQCRGLRIVDIEAVATMCPRLISFDFSEAYIDRGSLGSTITQPILRWSSLQELRLRGYGFDDEFIAKLIIECPQLQKIDFWDFGELVPNAKEVTEVGIAKLSSLPKITSLKLNSFRELNVDRVITAFECMSNLEHLELGLGCSCDVDDSGWKNILDKCPRLQYFGMNHYRDETIEGACRIMDTLPDRRQLTIVIIHARLQCHMKPEIKVEIEAMFGELWEVKRGRVTLVRERKRW